jgi:hypothetical protein
LVNRLGFQQPHSGKDGGLPDDHIGLDLVVPGIQRGSSLDFFSSDIFFEGQLRLRTIVRSQIGELESLYLRDPEVGEAQRQKLAVAKKKLAASDNL